MISIISEPERIINGETLKVKLNIEGKANISQYKNMYFNIVIKKNGGTHGSVILYPLKYIGCSLEWEVNPYSYGSDGTFNVGCTLQNSQDQISSTTFVVEPDCAESKASSCNNITTLLSNINLRKGIAKKQVETINHFQSFQVENPHKTTNSQEINYKEKEIEKKKLSNEFDTQLLSSVKVQRAYKNI